PLILAATAVSLAFTHTSHADDSKASAQELFVDGRELVAHEHYLEGCAKLERSETLDPAPGTELNLADCYEKVGRLADAWIAFREASEMAARSGRGDWARQATDRATRLSERVPKVTVMVDEDIPGLAIRGAGETL